MKAAASSSGDGADRLASSRSAALSIARTLSWRENGERGEAAASLESCARCGWEAARAMPGLVLPTGTRRSGSGIGAVLAFAAGRGRGLSLMTGVDWARL